MSTAHDAKVKYVRHDFMHVFRSHTAQKMYFGHIESPISPGCQNLAIEMQANCTINISPSRVLRKRKRPGKENAQGEVVMTEDQPPPTPKKIKQTLKISKKGTCGKKFRLYCEHCKAAFYSKATYREKYQHHLVNHRCDNNTRMQYVVGIRHRRCTQNCDPQIGCIRFASLDYEKK